ncbi:hypothetical protein SAY87_011708 [Trapa incisa]|uniref:TF-B3 domain-containing protein n=1 Tax=Trapa incisa TaxID=236973 RepID=A0AAN7GJP0_9MYRT|nr:hypothetical protein SAY87_011708 [Trapa incisa]
MENSYSPFPKITIKNSSHPQPPPNEQYPHYYHRRHPPILPNPSSSSSPSTSSFLYDHQRPSSILHHYFQYSPQGFMVNPLFNQSVSQPFWLGPAVQNPMPHSVQTIHQSFPDGFTRSISDYTNSSSNVVATSMERTAAAAASNAWTTKIARSKRKMAMQKGLNLNTGSSSGDLSDPSPHSYYEEPEIIASMHEVDESSIRYKSKDPYDLIIADNKKLKVILRKELKNSDVGSLGRIVIPKKQRKSLLHKEGIQVMIRDINSYSGWSVKYMYWSNNKSRMYVLENTGEFVKENGLEMGDTMILHGDNSHNIYFSIKKAYKPRLQQKSYHNLNCLQGTLYVTSTTHEEEDASLALLIEQLRHREQQDITLQLMDYPSTSQDMMDPSQQQSFNCFNEQYNNNNKNSSNINQNSSTHLDGINPCTFSFLKQWSRCSRDDQ